MEELIKMLNEKASENIKDGQNPEDCHWGYQYGVLLSNAQAIDIAAAFEKLTYPPIVRAALAILDAYHENKTGMAYDWAAIGIDKFFFMSESQPYFLEDSMDWGVDGLHTVVAFGSNIPYKWDIRQMIFHRAESGWEWVGRPLPF